MEGALGGGTDARVPFEPTGCAWEEMAGWKLILEAQASSVASLWGLRSSEQPS